MTVSPTTPTGPMPSPERVFDAFFAYQKPAALRAAIELDLFTRIAEGAQTAPELAARCGASERGIRILCDFLTINGFLTKSGSDYRLAPDSEAFLNKHSPAYMGSIAYFLTSDYLLDNFRDLAASVRKGGTARTESGLDPEHPMWVEFARSMVPMMAMPANMIADILLAGGSDPMKVLDIAAGHGLFGITLAQRNPKAGIVAVDWSNVLEFARQNAEQAGVADRWESIQGSAFEVAFGAGYDLALVTNFLHHFDPPTNELLLGKIKEALRPGGQVAILEFVPNDDRVSPPMAASFSLMMLSGTPSGDAYTFGELEKMLINTGFINVRRQDLLPTPQTLILASA